MLPFGDGKHNWLSSIYGRMIEDVITNFVYPLPSDPDILVTSFTNGNSRVLAQLVLGSDKKTMVT